MNDAIVAVLGLALFFLFYALLTAGRKHRGCTRCLDDEDAPRCDACPLSLLGALEARRHAADDSGADIDAERAIGR